MVKKQAARTQQQKGQLPCSCRASRHWCVWTLHNARIIPYCTPTMNTNCPHFRVASCICRVPPCERQPPTPSSSCGPPLLIPQPRPPNPPPYTAVPPPPPPLLTTALPSEVIPHAAPPALACDPPVSLIRSAVAVPIRPSPAVIAGERVALIARRMNLATSGLPKRRSMS